MMKNFMITGAAALIIILSLIFPTVIVPFIVMSILHALGYSIGFGTCFLVILFLRWIFK